VVNRPTAKVAVLVLVAFALTIAFAGTAFAHHQDSASLNCATVTGTFSQFGSGDHPIVWHVALDGHAYQAVATAESPPGFVGNGTATAGIATLTKALGPAGGSVSAYADWPGGRSPTITAQVTCDAPPPTTSPPPTSPPPTSPHGPPGPPAPPPIGVIVSPAPTAFAPPTATVAVPVVATPATTG
jgi:hypothetical protein